MSDTVDIRKFDVGDPLPDEYRELLYRVLKVAADTETSLLFPETDWLDDFRSKQYRFIDALAP